MWEGVGVWTELQHIDPHSIGYNNVSFPFSWAAQPGTWRPSLSGTCSSIQHLISNSSDPHLQLLNRGPEGPRCRVLAFSTASCLHLQLFWSSDWLNFLCTELYNSSTCTFFLWASQIALIQPIHGQGYTLLFLDRMHQLFTQVHFLFWQPGWVVGPYTTHRGKQPLLHSPNEYPRHEIKILLMLRLQSWNFGKFIIPLYLYYSRVH